jgi:hypothetical protein
MESISSEIFEVLKYLLPGFITSWIFHALTDYPKQNQFERIIQALIFTIFIQCAVLITKSVLIHAGKIYSFGAWDKTSELLWSLLFSISMGICFVYLIRHGTFHALMSRLGISNKSHYLSEWEDIFNNNPTYIIVNLKNDRRISGWPIIFPSDPCKGHLILQNPAWVHNGEYLILHSAQYITISVSDIEHVEFLKMKEI